MSVEELSHLMELIAGIDAGDDEMEPLTLKKITPQSNTVLAIFRTLSRKDRGKAYTIIGYVCACISS